MTPRHKVRGFPQVVHERCPCGRPATWRAVPRGWTHDDDGTPAWEVLCSAVRGPDPDLFTDLGPVTPPDARGLVFVDEAAEVPHAPLWADPPPQPWGPVHHYRGPVSQKAGDLYRELALGAVDRQAHAGVTRRALRGVFGPCAVPDCMRPAFDGGLRCTFHGGRCHCGRPAVRWSVSCSEACALQRSARAPHVGRWPRPFYYPSSAGSSARAALPADHMES